MRYWVFITAFMLSVISTAAQTEYPYIAFRVDDQHVIANLIVREQDPPQVREGLSFPPIARYGYEYFEIPKWWKDVPTGITPGEQWFLQTSAGHVVPATVERLVGGYLDCSPAMGVLLNVAPEGLKGIRTRYFLATKTPPAIAPTPHGVRTLFTTSLSSQLRQSIEQALNELMTRELPRVRAEAAKFLNHDAQKGQYYHDRVWAQQRLRIEEDMPAGRYQLRYEVQAFQLSPDRVPVYFIRAEWKVGRPQGFAATMWARGHDQLEVLKTSVWGASAIRMSLFRDGVRRSHMGLILNVFDHDRDGWGEVLFAGEGYESKTLTLLEYSPTGLTETGVQFAGGC